MAKPPQMHLESDAAYALRMAVEYPERYPLSRSHGIKFSRLYFWFHLWFSVGSFTGCWWPFLAYVDRTVARLEGRDFSPWRIPILEGCPPRG